MNQLLKVKEKVIHSHTADQSFTNIFAILQIVE